MESSGKVNGQVDGQVDGTPRNPDFTTDVVVVGTGPAGGALSAFLGTYGVKGIVVGYTSSTAETPRAHITNMATMECLRDFELDDELRKLASPKEAMAHTRWGYSMVGEEFARAYSWGNGPLSEGRYKLASPCEPMDLPQTRLEPVLIRKATSTNFRARFNTEFLHYEEDVEPGFIDVLVKDLIFNHVYRIRTRYLFGADGARSKIIKQLGLPLRQRSGGGLAWNVLVKVDLSKNIEYRTGNLHWCYQHDLEHPDFAWIGFPRMVKPWNEWVFIMFPVQGYEPSPPPTHEQWSKRIQQMIGDDTIPFEILDISKWNVNDIVAEKYSKGRIFCLGDAVHRHPPANGLGSNTCIQDAYNLAWKVAYVTKGLAGEELLNSYEEERQPVGVTIVDRAFQGYLDHLPLWKSVGILAPDAATRVANFKELSANTPEGRERRKAFQAAIHGTRFEYNGVGVEMNQRYVSNAVYQADQGEMPPLKGDPILEHHKTTYPGARVPHVWLNHKIPNNQISTIDLTGKGKFVLLTGIGGDAWKEAAKAVSQTLKVPIESYSIGFRQDYEDVYFEWETVREVEEDGCVLVRPDRFVAWRSMTLVENSEDVLLKVLQSILSRK